MKFETNLLRFLLLTVAFLPLGMKAAMSPPMKAVVMHSYGGPEVLKVQEVPRPEPKEDEVLVRVIAASINPVDVAIRKGYLAELIGNKLPLIPGMDAAGIVEKTGSKIRSFKAGDPVYAFFTLADEGGYAEYVTAKENEIALKPKQITYAQAAAVPAAASTAWQVLVDTAKLSAGQKVLIHGGSVGSGILRFKSQGRAVRR
jgi:NADPH:quinone reductase-like Zn-dependent oxidoreductase